MNTEEFEWKGYKWITRERWGDIHPDKPWAKYDSRCVSIDKDNNLILDIKPYYMRSQGDPEWMMGLVSSHQDNPRFGFGYYEWVAKLPKGKHLWPALWMWSFDSWPPELDVIEAWTDKHGKYKYNINHWNITTCAHYSEDDKHEAERLKIPCIFKSSEPYKKFNQYSMLWTEDKLTFYYNQDTIRVIDDKSKIDWINKKFKIRHECYNEFVPNC